MIAYEFLKTVEWTQGALARKADGSNCEMFSEEAVAFCLSGVVLRTYKEKANEAYKKIYDLIGLNVNVIKYNDDPSRTKEDVLQLFLDSGV